MISDKDDDIAVTKEADYMSTSVLEERYCTVRESIIESFKEVKLMRECKLPKQTWKDFIPAHNHREMLKKFVDTL